jgi:hypothetical protein
MIKPRGNPNWGKPTPFTAAGVSSFEIVVRSLGLVPNQYQGSALLRDWVEKNKHNKYVPPDLLTAWGMNSASEI